MTDALKIFAGGFLPATEGHPSPEIAVGAFTGAATAFAAAALAGGRGTSGRTAARCVLAVVPGLPEADRLTEDLETLEDDTGVRALAFPPSLEDDTCSTAAHFKVSAALGAWSLRPYPFVIVAPVAALEEGVPVADDVTSLTVRLAPGRAPAFAELQRRLLAAGYERAGEVTERGQFSVRGGVLDAWSPDAGEPVRAEYFGDDLEDLRTFDPGLQTSTGKCAEAAFTPLVAEAKTLRPLTDLMPSGSAALLVDHNAYAGSAPPPDGFAKTVYVGDPAPAGVPTSPWLSSPLPGFAEWCGGGAGEPAVEAIRARLRRHLDSARARGAEVVRIDDLSAGFETEGLVVLAKRDRMPLPRGTAHRRAATAARQGARLSEAMDLEPGELVVHVDHGIGRYLGTTEIEVGGTRSEVFSIEYADGAKLHVPVAHAHLLSRYVGVKGENVRLHRLDGTRWTKEKADADRSVRDLAAALLETQAKREAMPGFACETDSPEIAAFERAFPYEPTPDQADAIDDVKRDLSSTRPMDRLVCGDAGFGKTEVAMRAAFVMAMNGRQTAVLAPTTVLAQQHYETFLARFDGTPVRIETLSRFCGAEEKAGVRARLASGASDIVIGTHAILSGKVRFRDLGLIVIDEEQRFGVRHKEQLKRLRATADVLTLSATPIPRTLYMALTGSRDLSVLKTPPRERVATETQIVRDADDIVRFAIERERARGGQVYYLYNRVMTIDRAERRLRTLAPDARIDVAHGQMPAPTLAAKMRAFAEGRTDILLCTSIVESGLDIPRANTILVDRADRFGIAELYQLRGRVGRSTRRGYAYFLLPEEGLVDEEARERLAALRKNAGHGSGYNLALRDLEIRGAGNLLGREQSGHIAAVGFGLYCQLLRRTVARLKGETVPDLVEVSVNLDFLDLSPASTSPENAAALPYDYVTDEAQRMDFHKRIAAATSVRDVARLKRELADRYGRLPKPAARLVKVAEFRMRCAEKGIERLDVRNGRCVFRFRDPEAPPHICSLPEGATTDGKLRLLAGMLEKMMR